jgi:FdhD protein
MRTPGADFDLAAGFLVSEAVIERADQLAAMRYCAGSDDGETNRFNVLDISLGARVAPPDPSV